MKKNIKYIKRISIFVLALVMTAACVKWEQETSPPLESASTVTLAVLSAGDSSVVVSFSSSADGYVALNLYEGTGNSVPTDESDLEALLTGNVSSMEYYSTETEAGNVYQYTFQGLIQDASYEVIGVANNSDGVVSQAELLLINTADSHPPMLTGTDPEIGYSPVLAVDGSVTLFFDEPVLYDDTKDLTFYEYFEDEEVVAGSVVVDGNAVTVTLGEDLTNRDYVWLSYPEGAFTDLSGNLAAEVATHQDGNQFVGLYWRAVAKEFEALSVSPEEELVPSVFDIVVEFAEEVNVDDVADGDITLTYDDGLDVLTKAVLAAELSATGNELTITQSYVAPPGVEITLNIPAEVLSIGIANPNAEVTATWLTELNIGDLVGNYTVAAASYGSPGSWDEVWTATVADAGDGTNLSITITSTPYGGPGVPFLAAVDTDALTITITAGTDAGDLYGYGPTAMHLGNYDETDLTADIVGTILGANSFNIDELTMYPGGVWDAFNSTWTKTATKAAVSGGNFNPSKAERFK